MNCMLAAFKMDQTDWVGSGGEAGFIRRAPASNPRNRTLSNMNAFFLHEGSRNTAFYSLRWLGLNGP